LGPVIPSAEVTRLFRPFERLATSRASNGHGHGLGLSIVAAIADAHHATIDAHAQPEGGLLVQVSFPGQPPDTIRAEFDHLPSDAEGLRMSTTGQPH
jgi:signal transduction histidine kinase